MEPEVADVFRGRKYLDWVRAKARKVDLETELDTVVELSEIMDSFLKPNTWAAASSNNIYWPKLKEPISVVRIPLDFKASEYVTLINPTLKRYGKYSCISNESCGSIIGFYFCIVRPAKVKVGGYVLEDYLKGKKSRRELVLNSPASTNASHELDHLEGKLISDIGLLLGYSRYVKKQAAYRHVLFDQEFLPRTQDALTSHLESLFLRSLKKNYLPENYLRLVLNVEKDASCWLLHSPTCQKNLLPSKGQLSMAVPDTPKIRNKLINNLLSYQEKCQPGSSAYVSMTLCECMQN